MIKFLRKFLASLESRRFKFAFLSIIGQGACETYNRGRTCRVRLTQGPSPSLPSSPSSVVSMSSSTSKPEPTRRRFWLDVVSCRSGTPPEFQPALPWRVYGGGPTPWDKPTWYVFRVVDAFGAACRGLVTLLLWELNVCWVCIYTGGDLVVFPKAHHVNVKLKAAISMDSHLHRVWVQIEIQWGRGLKIKLDLILSCLAKHNPIK